MSEDVAASFEIKKLSILDEHGVLDESLKLDLSDDDIKGMYVNMNLSRTLNQKMLNLQKQGRIGTFASILGQEGGEVALATAIKDLENIWLVPSFRETAVMVTRGIPMIQILQYWGGYENGSAVDPSFRVLPVNIPIGSQVSHAVGLSMAMKIKEERGAAISFFGDGGTSEGETMEAMNFGGAMHAPTIFFCQNNQYAISTPRIKQTAAKTLAQKAVAYGFPGIQVDGNDVFAVYRTVREAVIRAMKGEGPTFIEAITYRLDNHTTADDWHKYRTEQEVDTWQKKDPFLRLRKYMEDQGMWDDKMEAQMKLDVEKQVGEAVDQYEKTPKPHPQEIFDSLYETLPPLIDEQRKQWVSFWGEHQ